MRLQTKVLLVVIPLAIAPLLILGGLAYQQLRSTAVDHTYSQLTTLMDQLATNFRIRTAVAEANTKLFSEAALMRAYALTADEEERYVLMLPSLLKLFKSYLRAYPEYREIRFLLPDGYEDARATLAPIPNFTEQEGDTPFFRSLRGFEGEIFSRVVTNPDNDEISLQVARPLKLINAATDDPLSTRPRLRGYLVLNVDLHFIAEQIAVNRVGELGHALVVDRSGRILFHPDPDRRGRSLPAELLEALERLPADSRQQRLVHDGRTALLAKRSIHDDLRLVGVVPAAELLEDGRELGMAVAWVTVGTVVVTIGALLVAINGLMVQPLRQLVRAVGEIGDGNLTPNVALSSRDELGQLALSFQRMGRSLEKSRHKIERLAYHDSLTDLPNRLQFGEYLQHMVALARRESGKMAVLFLDLDNFKRVNDTLGHQVGDQLLKETALRLHSVLRAADFVSKDSHAGKKEVLARLGGDEFIILLPRIGGSHDAAKVAARILEAMKERFYIDGRELYSGASIGITLFPDDGSEVNDLIKRADNAMYHAKEQGRNNYQFYSASYNLVTSAHLSLEGRLRRALGGNELELYYQPQIEAVGCRVVGVEALLRWNDPEHGIVLPDQFIPIAEDSGLILQIGEWVLREACRQCRAWNALPGGVFVSVNVSGIQLQRQELGALVDQVLSATGLDASLLELEVTESVLMKVRQEVVEDLARLRRRGVAISLDDFGTGYSSLNRLRELPIDKLKIDRTFVQGMVANSRDAAIVSAILFIAKSLGLQTTAEGVETREQMQRLQTENCDLIQGFLLGRPMTAAAMTKLLEADRRTATLQSPGAASLRS